MGSRWLVGALVCTVAHAAPSKEAPPPATFDNDAGLAHWKAALAAQKAKPDRPLRISFFGDSLTADDHITNELRTRLGALVGDGGPGFVFAAPPHPYCSHRAVSRFVTGEWRINGISSSPAPDRLLGLGGSAESADQGSVRMTLAKATIKSVDVHYLRQPHGGRLDVLADGNVLQQLVTNADHKQAAFTRVEVPDGTKKIDLRASGRVRLFGASLEAPKGAIVDNLGVVNATAKQLQHNNMPEHWRNQLAHRGSDLVIIMLGTNEAEWLAPKTSGMAEHERLFGELLASVRAGNPTGSCLVVSPLDQIDWRAEGMPPRASVPAMVEAQQRAATAAGCAFWNTYAWMGGAGSSREWFKAGLVVKDFQHPTNTGALRIADALYAGLIR